MTDDWTAGVPAEVVAEGEQLWDYYRSLGSSRYYNGRLR
jgi:hypothetical protein